MTGVAMCLWLPVATSFIFPVDHEHSFDDHLLVSTASSLKGHLGSVLVTLSGTRDHQPGTIKYLQEALGPIQISSLGGLSSKLTICLIQGSWETLITLNNIFWNTEYYYLLNFIDGKQEIDDIFYHLWDTHRVYRVFIVSQKTYTIKSFDPVLRIIHKAPIEVFINTNSLNQRFPDWNMTDFYAVYAGLYADKLRESRSFLVDRLTLEALTERLNMRLKIKNTTDDSIKFGIRSENGSFYGTFKELVTYTANMTAQAHFIKIHNILDSLTYSVPARADKICIAVPRSERIPRFVESFNSVNVTVWLSIVLIYLITMITLSCFRFFFYRVNRRVIYETSLPLTMFGICLGLPVDYMPRLHFEKLVLSSILLVSLVVVSVMQSTLNAILSTPPSFYKFPNNKDEFNEQMVNVWTSSKDLIDSYVAAGYTGVKFHLKTAAEQKKDFHTIIYKGGILEKMAAFLRAKELEFKFVKLQMTEACPVQHNIAYLYPKGSPFEEPINRILSGLVESGVMLKWDRSVYQFSNRTMQFVGKVREVVELNPLSLEDLGTPLYFSCWGFVVAILVFIFEKLIHGSMKKLRTDHCD
ncbi:unnamed protein product [Nezara viridula]|uniref:Uncharacterized protein n=1 Tax=Nezara viridula TaxID=85310 RepID=A0A9P0HE58_NEZVI|nr:unnamed protein product [Nezara viridula]